MAGILVGTGQKTFEVRRNDRGFKVGDTLILKEWDCELAQFTGRELSRAVSYVMEGGSFGIDPKFVVNMENTNDTAHIQSR